MFKDYVVCRELSKIDEKMSFIPCKGDYRTVILYWNGVLYYIGSKERAVK